MKMASGELRSLGQPGAAVPTCSVKQCQIYRISHRLMTCRPGMQMIPTVRLRSHASRNRRVAEGGVKIDAPVEGSRSSNPLIHRHALRLTRCGPGTKALIRKNGRAKNLEAAGVRSSDDLFVSGDDFIRCHLRAA